ncbi:MAG: hypothetical protein NVS9B12_03650 [Vulcanimicrobiaceae bacterium]
MQTRPGTLADLDRLERLPAQEDWSAPLAMLRSAIRARRTMVAESGPDVVAMAVWDRDFFGRAFIWMLAVHPAHRRQGFASALIAHIEAECKGEPLFISTNRSNASMLALCGGRGFLQSGCVDNLDPGDPEIFFHKIP